MGRERLPHELIVQVQKYTDAPWWNGEAYATFKGYPQRIRNLEKETADAIDDLHDVMEWLREEKQYRQSDRIRTIIGRMARTLDYQGDPKLFVVAAKTYK